MYQNFMDQINLSSLEIEKQISLMKLSFPQQKDHKMEWKTMPPMFISSFYQFVAQFNKIPYQQEFWGYYYHTNQNEFSDYIKTNIQFLKARCYRAFPSFVRDIHFYYIMKESEIFEHVFYHPDIDIEYGIDFILKYKDFKFGVNCYIDTKRSYQGRNKKQHRHDEVKKIIPIDLPVELKGSKKCGRFFLYSNRELQQLIQLLNKKISSLM